MSDLPAAPRASRQFAPGAASRWTLAGDDVALAVSGWRIWTSMAWNDIAQRYRRSAIGPFWLTLSTGIFVGALGVLYAQLLHQDITTYLPYLTAGYVVWGLLSSFFTEAAQSFTSAEGYLRQMRLSKISLVLRTGLRNFIIFLHNAVIIAIVCVIFSTKVTWDIVLILPALLIIFWFGTATALLLGLICTRFRDIHQIVVNLVGVLFFITPIMWDARTSSRALHSVSSYNPLSALLSIFRDPLLGIPIEPMDWIVAISSTIGMSVVAAVFFIRFRGRIVYWL